MEQAIGERPSATGIQLPNSEQFRLGNEQGQEYLIQISWPLEWHSGHGITGEVPIIYIVDGNALFFTATETAWRRATSFQYAGGGIIVAIGYPSLEGKLFDMQSRSFDLTPPPPPTTDSIAGHGGADIFLNFIERTVKPAVRTRFPRVTITREALFGHSYGGLFALHALFTRSGLFDCYIASSPSIWWNTRCIEQEATRFLLEKPDVENMPRPSLMVFWGSLEQDAPRRTAKESMDDYKIRRKIWLDLRMIDNARELCDMLSGCERLQTVLAHEFEGEEHTSVMACSVNRGLTTFFEVWPL